MELDKRQQEMLAGQYGNGTAMAMKIQLAIGEAFGASRMVPITRAHVALSNQEADLWFVEKILKAGAKCVISPTTNPGFSLQYFTGCPDVLPEDIELMNRTHNAYKEIGAVLTYTCTPYMGSNIPHFGEIVAFSESSATPFINSVWGARSNRESAQSALCAAITGYVPEYGLLLAENRLGDILVEVKATMKSDFEYQLLGYMGKKIGSGIPVFVGLPQTISPEALMNLGAQLNTSGAYGMYHIVGFTPEARTVEQAFGGKKPKRSVVITDDDLQKILAEISAAGDRKVDFAMFGCPHISISQVQMIAEIVNGKKLAIETWLLTSSYTKQLAERMGLQKIINDAGGEIVEDSCPDQPCWRHLQGKVGVTDSPKCAYYPKRRGMDFIIRDLATCVEAALKGDVQ